MTTMQQLKREFVEISRCLIGSDKAPELSLRIFLVVHFVSQQPIFLSEHKGWNVAPWVFWADLMQPIIILGIWKFGILRKPFMQGLTNFITE
jgi:hypothetical protein